ncbi:MAG: radical SAM family heme chaperone HemW [Campylobacterota bacterium]
MLLYIHIPFCDSKCYYCSFNSYTNQHFLIPRYFDALYEQLEDIVAKHNAIRTVFIGGGTPSCVDASYYEPILQMLPRGIEEITIEANPNSADAKWQEQIARLGADRISFGMQSFDTHKLRHLNRSHSPKQGIEAIQIAKQNFARVSMDMIYNTQVDSVALLQKDLEQFFALEIEHLSAYELTVESGTKFEGMELGEDRYWEFIKTSLEANGFKQYEVSNFGQPSLHNLGYWQYEQYLGAGAGAIGMVDGVRYSMHKEIERYIDEPFYSTKEYLSDADIATEKLFLGLRSCVGFEPDSSSMEQKAQHLLKHDKLIKIRNRYYNENFSLADELALYLLK